MADWRSINLRIPAGPTRRSCSPSISGYAGQPQKRGTLTLNRSVGRSGELGTVLEPVDRAAVRTWLRFVHTGEFYGLTGQTIAGVVSVGGGVLVYTGLALAFRRFVAWRARRRSPTRDYQQPAA